MSIAEKLQTIAENEQKVYEAGKQAEWSEFWDNYQNRGEAISYNNAFSYNKFSKETYKPKYNIKVSSGSTTAQFMFRDNSLITDTLVDIDVSEPSQFTQAFDSCSNLVTIRKLIVSDKLTYGTSFNKCYALKNITFEGIIGNNISFSASTKLTHDSLMNVIEHLKDLTGTDLTRTLTLGDTNLAKLTDSEKAIATQKGWTLA